MEKYTFFLILFSAFALSLSNGEQIKLEAGANGLVVNVDTTTGAYSIAVDGVTWFNSGATAIHSSGTWFKSGSTLRLMGSSTSSGSDKFGPFKSVTLKWQATTIPIPFETTFVVSANEEIILFQQTFPTGMDLTSVATDNNTVVSSFPTLPATGPSADPLYFYTYRGTFALPVVGKWSNPTNFPGAVDGGSPLILYNGKLRTLVFSPYENFMTGVQVLAKDLNGFLSFGLNGKILRIPTGYTHTTILRGGQGITNTIMSWGDALLSQYGKKRTSLDADILIKSLGYWTDNGAYYYYITEPGKNYAQTMVDVKDYISSIKLPVTNYQFDSWWYFKGANGGVTIWEPTPQIFPDGMAAVTAKLEAPVALHNRWFAPDSPYLKNFSFIVESYAALPASQDIFDHIMGKAKSWGMILYEQDWLVTTYMSMESTKNNLTNAKNWLIYMGDAATKLDITIQYCMPLPNHLMQSVAIPSVTQSRASDDYNPSNFQWQLFHTSTLIWALGMVPFKDDFWTTNSIQTGCKYTDHCIEYTPVLEALVSSLTAGPVGPSDQIGKIDRDLVMKTCRSSGDLLKADLPAFPLESTFLPQSNGVPSLIQVAASHTQFGDNRWYYVLGANLKAAFNVTTNDLPVTRASKVFDYFAVNGTVSTYDSSHPISFPAAKIVRTGGLASGPVEFNYHIIAPVTASGWVLLGETSKFITVSKQRITDITSSTTELSLTIVGTAGEQISLAFLNTAAAQQKVIYVQFPISSGGRNVVVCASGANGVCKFSQA